MNIILLLHSHFRWIVILTALITLVKYLFALIGKKGFTKSDRIIGLVFVSAIDTQISLGLTMLFMRVITDTFSMQTAEHLVIMSTAVTFAHIPAKWRKNTESSIRLRKTLLCYVITLLFILIGILRLRGSLVW